MERGDLQQRLIRRYERLLRAEVVNARLPRRSGAAGTGAAAKERFSREVGGALSAARAAREAATRRSPSSAD
jgi:hypothetical protein